MRTFSFSKTLLALASAAALLLLPATHLFAGTIPFSASAVSATTLGPSSDSISFNAASDTYTPGSGTFVLQTGDFVIGDSSTLDQNISFSFQDTVTFNGVTHVLTLFGTDDVTPSIDTLTILGGQPVAFGNEVLTLQTLSVAETSIADFPIQLQASAGPALTPEPQSIVLLGSGLVGGLFFIGKRKPLAPTHADFTQPAEPTSAL